MNLNSDQFGPARKAISIAGAGRGGNPFLALARVFGAGNKTETQLRLHVQKQIMSGAIGAAAEHEKYAARMTGTHEGLQAAGWGHLEPKSVGPQGSVFQSTWNPTARKNANQERDTENPDPGAAFPKGEQPGAGFHGGADDDDSGPKIK